MTPCGRWVLACRWESLGSESKLSADMLLAFEGRVEEMGGYAGQGKWVWLSVGSGSGGLFRRG